MRVVRALGDKFVAVWERQEKGRLHMHIFMSFDKNSVPDRNRLCEIWMAALPPAALVKSDGSKYSASEVLNFKYGIHIVKFHLEDRRGPHPFTYLAKGSQTYTPH
jgi:hypothetical protein